MLRLIICFIQILPIEACTTLAKIFSYFAQDVLRFRRKVIDENLTVTFPQISGRERNQIARGMWRHLFLMICETAQAPRTIHEGNWRRFVHIRDKKLMTEYFLDGRPLVMVSGHFGNFEMGSYIAGVLGIPTWTVGKTIGNPYIDGFVRRFRSIRGQHLLPFEGSANQVSEVLAENEILTLLGDQHAGRRGVWVEFFGRPASCHKALALFTLTQKAPMVVTYTKRVGKPMQFEIGCEGIAEPDQLNSDQESVRGLTQWYNDRLESIVRRDPDQYWWVHRRWKDKPGKRWRRKPAA